LLSLGIDIGYSAIKVALIDKDKILWDRYVMHRGKAIQHLKDMLRDLCSEMGEREGSVTVGAVIGSGGRLITPSGDIAAVTEVAAFTEGGLFLAPQITSIIEIGGQNAKYICGFSKASQKHVKVSMNSSCASGTGSFLEEQVSRLELDIEDFSELAGKAMSIPRIAARCSVFAKSDIIHHQQEGVPVEDILLGLAYGVSRNYKNNVIKGRLEAGPVLFTGGVSKNKAMVGALGEVLKLDPSSLIVHEKSALAGAIGAALLAKEEERPLRLKELMKWLEDRDTMASTFEDDELVLPCLQPYGNNDAEGKHFSGSMSERHSAAVPAWLGIDVGSTSTNLVLLNGKGQVLAFRYLRTAGDPQAAVCRGLGELEDQIGKEIDVSGVGVTGSGRVMIGNLVGADVVKDEITAQARAAVHIDPQVDTVFEIGGQDSKFISIDGGAVSDFQMNKICAAGTGSFIEEQAAKLDIPLDGYGDTALRGLRPANLGERCTVFMEASVSSHLARGTSIEDIAAGLCYSIVKNYLNRVVGHKRIGNRIFLQGGIAYNQGVVNAFRSALGKNISVPPFFSVTGALGAALLAREEMPEGKKTSFKGFGTKPLQPIAGKTVIPVPAMAKAAEGSGMDRFSKSIDGFLFREYTGTIDPAKKTVGIPRSLFIYGMFPMFYPFFTNLGVNVLLSSPSSEKTIKLAQEYSLGETCFPIKLVNGHIAELVEKKVDAIFFPDLHAVFHPGSCSRQDYGCAYMQLAFKMVNQAMDLEKRGISLLAPTIAFNMGKEFIFKSFLRMGVQLGKSAEETKQAAQGAMQGFQTFEKEMEERARKTMAELPSSEKTFVIISKIYGVADPMLNMGIPGKLMDMGYRVLPFYEIPDDDLSKEHPNMYWPFGQHILEAAKQVKKHDNLYAVFLSHHGCGPDTVLSHYFREIMGDKPYLQVEVDEHSSPVGVSTRVEAFVNSLEHRHVHRCGKASSANHTSGERNEEEILLPPLFPYSAIIGASLSGNDVSVLPAREITTKTIDTGRQYVMANEYLSMTATLGYVLSACGGSKKHTSVILPQNEGAEVDGQFGSFVQTILHQEGMEQVEVKSPFIEDLLLLEEGDFRNLIYCIIAGDLVMAAPPAERNSLLERVVALAKAGTLRSEQLTELAGEISSMKGHNGAKNILALGEPTILFNGRLNNHLFDSIEEKGFNVLYAPFSEYLWSFWHDLTLQPDRKDLQLIEKRARFIRYMLIETGMQLKSPSSFDPEPEALLAAADSYIGYYAGAFGRYRAAKALHSDYADGIVSVASMYENTDVSLGIMQRRPESDNDHTPCLQLSFDGNDDPANTLKIESFLHYI